MDPRERRTDQLRDPEAWSGLVRDAADLSIGERRSHIYGSEAPASLWPLLFEAANARAEALVGPLGENSSVNLEGIDLESRLPVPFAALKEIQGYDDFEHLGSGGQGQVYRARHKQTGRVVAIKVRRWSEPAPADGCSFDYEALGPKERRFRKGILGLQTLSHPSISTVYDADIIRSLHGDFCFTAQELIEDAQPLTHYARGLAGSRERLELFSRLVEAIDYAHDQGVVHRDLKPGNVIVGADGRLVVIDFDAAQIFGGSILFSSTSGGADISIQYTSPEQLQGKRVDHRADIYSLGVILHEMLTGKCPSLRDGIQGLADAVLLYDPPRIQGQRSRLERDMESIALRCMRKRPSERYGDAESALQDVQSALVNGKIEARPVSFFDRVTQLAVRHRVRLAVAVAAMTAGAAIYFGGRTQILANEKSSLEKQLTLFRDVATALRMDEGLSRIDVTGAGAVLELDRLHEAANALYVMHADYRRDVGELEASAQVMEGEQLARWQRMHPMAMEIETLEVSLQDQEERLARGEKVDTDLLASRRAKREESIALRDRDRPIRLESAERDSELFLKRMAVNRATDLESGWSCRWAERRAAAERVQQAWDNDRDLWVQVAADIQSDERFDGLKLAQQRGLKPLGKDPKSGLHEFAHLASNFHPASRLNAEQSVRPALGTGLTMVLVPGGDVQGLSGRPQLDSHFVSKFELTQGQRDYLVGSNPSYWKERLTPGLQAPSELRPAERVSFIEIRPALLAHGLDLPTAAQGEFSARAGSKTRWSFGDDASDAHRYCNFNDACAAEIGGEAWIGHTPDQSDGFPTTAPVGSFLANPWGLHDVHGNVGELTKCDSGAGEDLRARSGDGWRSIPGSPLKIQRGGSYMFGLTSSRSDHLATIDESGQSKAVGARPVRLVVDAEKHRVSSQE